MVPETAPANRGEAPKDIFSVFKFACETNASAAETIAFVDEPWGWSLLLFLNYRNKPSA